MMSQTFKSEKIKSRTQLSPDYLILYGILLC